MNWPLAILVGVIVALFAIVTYLGWLLTGGPAAGIGLLIGIPIALLIGHVGNRVS